MFVHALARLRRLVRPAAAKPRPRVRPAGLEPLEDRCVPAIFTVTTLADAGAGSFRQALLDANAAAGSDTITFGIAGTGVKTIDVLSALPTISERVAITGLTQPLAGGRPAVELNGSGAGAGVHGLVIAAGADNSQIVGMTINGFSGHGVVVASRFNFVARNQIGVRTDGTTPRGNGLDGIAVFGSNNLIGNTDPLYGNVISGNGQNGVHLFGTGAILNTIQGNNIGVGAAAQTRVGNGLDGIAVQGGANGNYIGGTSAGARNILSGNGRNGVGVFQGSYIAVVGNFIGVNGLNTAQLGNGAHGVQAFGAATSNIDVGAAGAGEGNTIAGNARSGVDLNATAGNRVVGNRIGMFASSNGTTSPVANGLDGVTVAGGGAQTISFNAIGGNARHGVALFGARGVTVFGNNIGVEIGLGGFGSGLGAGTAGLGNAGAGISVAAGSVGNSLLRNRISGNRGAGIDVSGSSHVAIDGNLIGHDLGADPAFANQFGVKVSGGATDVALGGTGAGVRNQISFNTQDGVFVDGVGAQAPQRVNVLGNSIFTNGGEAIDLGPNGPTANDALDADSGANGLQNKPTVTGFAPGGAVTGTFSGKANATFRIEIFVETGGSCDFIGFASVVTNAAGLATFSIVPAFIFAPAFLTATATGAEGTSEKSAPFLL